MRLVVLTFALLLASSAAAEDRSAKIQALMEAQGLVSMFSQQLELGREQSRKQGQQMLDQLMGSLNPPTEFRDKFQVAATEFMEALQAPWTAQEIVDVWGGIYGKHFSDSELDELIKFYVSPLGQKEVASSRTSLVEFGEHFSKQYQPTLDAATTRYIERLQQIIKECNCAR